MWFMGQIGPNMGQNIGFMRFMGFMDFMDWVDTLPFLYNCGFGTKNFQDNWNCRTNHTFFSRCKDKDCDS